MLNDDVDLLFHSVNQQSASFSVTRMVSLQQTVFVYCTWLMQALLNIFPLGLFRPRKSSEFSLTTEGKIMEGLGGLIPVINKLQDVFTTINSKQIELPQIVVVGMQVRNARS